MDAGPGTALGFGSFAVSWLVMMAAMMLPGLVPAAIVPGAAVPVGRRPPRHATVVQTQHVAPRQMALRAPDQRDHTWVGQERVGEGLDLVKRRALPRRPPRTRRSPIEGLGMRLADGSALEVAWRGASRFAAGEGRGRSGAGSR